MGWRGEKFLLHIDEDVGPFVSHEGFDVKFDNGMAVPRLMFFAEYSYSNTERKFSGLLDFAGNTLGGAGSISYEVIFDTIYMCVVSGNIVYRNQNGADKIRKFLVD